jgi:hypothetical protein
VATPLAHHPERSPGLMVARERGRGRRAHLDTAADAQEVDAWTDDAVGVLCAMADSCSLDVAERGPQRSRAVARALGTSRWTVQAQTRSSLEDMGLDAARNLLEFATLIRLGLMDGDA